MPGSREIPRHGVPHPSGIGVGDGEGLAGQRVTLGVGGLHAAGPGSVAGIQAGHHGAGGGEGGGDAEEGQIQPQQPVPKGKLRLQQVAGGPRHRVPGQSDGAAAGR